MNAFENANKKNLIKTKKNKKFHKYSLIYAY